MDEVEFAVSNIFTAVAREGLYRRQSRCEIERLAFVRWRDKVAREEATSCREILQVGEEYDIIRKNARGRQNEKKDTYSVRS